MSEKRVMPPRPSRDGITCRFLSGFTGTRKPQDTWQPRCRTGRRIIKTGSEPTTPLKTYLNQASFGRRGLSDHGLLLRGAMVRIGAAIQRRAAKMVFVCHQRLSGAAGDLLYGGDPAPPAGGDENPEGGDPAAFADRHEPAARAGNGPEGRLKKMTPSAPSRPFLAARD